MAEARGGGEGRMLLACAWPYRIAIAFAIVLMLAETGAALVVPWVGGQLAGHLVGGEGTGIATVHAVLWWMLALFAGQAILKFATAYLLDAVADRVSADLRVRLYDHLQALPVAYFDRSRLGDMLALLTNDVYVVGYFISGTAVTVLPLLVTAAGAVVLMFGIRPDLALFAIVLVPAFYFLLKVAGRSMRPLSAKLQDEHARIVAIAHENLGMLPAIKSFTREPAESARFRDQVGRVLELSARQRRVQAALGPMVQFVAAAALVLVFALASADILEGKLAPAALVSFLLYAQLLSRPVAGLADVYGNYQVVRGALGRLARVMAEPAEPAGHAGERMPPVEGHIEFRGVRFGYHGREPALDGLDLRIAAGETVAIVGPNGAGKSTLAHLLMRLHDPQEGTIAIDGVDVARVSLKSLREQIGVVPQHVMLFNASVRDNIAYGRGDADAASIEAAARAAGAHGFILELPQGYDTPVGDHGVRLSGGQRQRLALARALLKDPPILVLDEATAMFDPEGEEDFLRSCQDLLRRRTVLLITHRPASLRVADRVLRLERGRIVAAAPSLRTVA